MTSQYRKDLDVLKGVAILAVVFYHLGILKSGYLGVDAFFVINGFFIIPSVLKEFCNESFSYIEFIKKRLLRLFPLITIATLVSMMIGAFTMLPDDFENLSQASIAANLMSENILSAITARSYWDVSNDYKPLMHLWYVGILVEFYILLPIIFYVSKALSNKTNYRSTSIGLLGLMSMVSLLLYILPIGSVTERFYFLHYRFFELGLGGLAGIYQNKLSNYKGSSLLANISLIAVIIIIGCSIINILKGTQIYTGGVIGLSASAETGIPLPSQVALLLTVFLTALVTVSEVTIFITKSSILSYFGKLSFSIFISHQIIIAYYRYCISNRLDCLSVAIMIVLTVITSVITYYGIEKCNLKRTVNKVIYITIPVIVLFYSGYVYMHAGVIRDIPELDVYKENVHRGMFSEYCDRIYKYKEFSNDKHKIKVLVVGVSFGRDFANILLESEYKDSIDLVYGWKWTDEGLSEKIKKCNYIFSFSSKSDIPTYVWANKKEDCEVWGISTKNFGSCNGIIYKNRNSENYFTQTVEILPGYRELNEQWREQWGSRYVDLLTISLVDANHVRVFTDNKKYISQDCNHLTQEGAKWYAQKIDWKNIFTLK